MPKPLPVGRELRQSTRCSPVANWWRQQQIHLCLPGEFYSSIAVLHISLVPDHCQNIPRMKLNFRMSVFSRSWLWWGRNPTVQNQHSALHFYFWRRKFMHRNAQKIQRPGTGRKTFSRRVVARPFLLCGHIPGPISSNNTENSSLLGWIFYDSAIQTNGLHWLEMSVLFVQRWHVQVTRHLAVVQGNYLLTLRFSLRCFSFYFWPRGDNWGPDYYHA